MSFIHLDQDIDICYNNYVYAGYAMRGTVMLKFIKNSKFGMTLGELLVVFVIMGIIATMTMVTVKPNEKSLKYVYYRMYNAIGTAFYNTSINMDDDLREEMTNAGAIDKSFPTTAEYFCKMLLEYINTKEGTAVTCSDANTVDVDDPEFTNDNTQFIASNGVKVWIGHSKDAAPGSFSTYTGIDDTNTEFSLRYYWVFVDLNGDMGPNSPTPRGSGMADIVAFIVTEDYDVIPIGRPEVDTRYFVSTVEYSATTGLDNEDVNSSTTMSYLEAKRHAWGEPNKKFYVSANEPMTMNFYDGTNITAASPFWLDYNAAEFNDIMAQTVDPECGFNPQPIDPEDPASGQVYEVEPDVCYINIKDYY